MQRPDAAGCTDHRHTTTQGRPHRRGRLPADLRARDLRQLLRAHAAHRAERRRGDVRQHRRSPSPCSGSDSSAFLVVFVADIVVAWALYILFKAVSQEISLLTAWFRLVYTAFLGVGVIFFFVVLQLVSGASYLTALGQGTLDAQVTAVTGRVQLRVAHRVGRVRHPSDAARLPDARVARRLESAGHPAGRGRRGLRVRHCRPRAAVELRGLRDRVPDDRRRAVGGRGAGIHRVAPGERRSAAGAAETETTTCTLVASQAC